MEQHLRISDAIVKLHKVSGTVTPDPLPTRPMVPTSSSDWEARKQTIRELYMDQNMILNEVIDIMLTKHKFKATARMYKGQFAKWKWTKYNKSGSHGSAKPTRSRAARKKAASVRASRSQVVERQALSTVNPHQSGSRPLFHHIYLAYFTDEECQVETTLSAYAALICHWCERETPWRTDFPGTGSGGRIYGELSGHQDKSILQHVRAAQDHFLQGRAQLGGETLRRAFLGIEAAIDRGLDVEALWDCCLAVPQLVLTTGWTDLLAIFTRYLHQYTHIKLCANHPLTRARPALPCPPASRLPSSFPFKTYPPTLT
ncbi:Clr5 domain-containing protein [Staphylotrichum tortipilum]|uniref:Clr5 domain-containing protein n=1 Tax=Staphylotrichum tortipilum TaxID=2831512 RepID=A0AAN6MPH8_9PEZI|nr:Clr5 domain-containing protein [Staphylotrichum longicolle]